MDAKRITTGIIFLFIGIILLLSKMDIIDFNWFEVFRYWPLLIILVGVNILVPKKILVISYLSEPRVLFYPYLLISV